jgi:integrase
MPRKRTAGRRRPRGEGSVYEVRSEGRWRGSVSVTEPDGRRRRLVVSGDTSDEAREKLAEAKKAVEAGARELHGRLTVSSYLQRWLAQHRGQVRASTWLARQGHIKNYIDPAIGRITMRKLTPSDVERMTSDMVSRGLSPRTAAHARTTLRLALRDAERDSLVTRNVAALARPPKVSRPEMQVLDGEQTRRLLAFTQDDRWHPLWQVLAGSGLRLGEALGLTWDDVDFDDATIAVRRSLAKVAAGEWGLTEPKTSRSRRIVPIPATTVRALREAKDRQDAERAGAGRDWQEHPEGQPVFADGYGRRFEPTYANRQLHLTLKRAGLPHIRLHDLRHGYASALLTEGVPLLTVSRLLGHSSIVITSDTYAHLTQSMTRDAAAAMGRVLGEGPG